MNTFRRRKAFLIPFAVGGFLANFSYAVFALWNGVVVSALSVAHPISYWQALGLLVLAKILFGGFPFGRGGNCGPRWREKMWAKRWESMSQEERAALREKMRHRFGEWPRPPWGDWCGEQSEAEESGKKASGPQ